MSLSHFISSLLGKPRNSVTGAWGFKPLCFCRLKCVMLLPPPALFWFPVLGLVGPPVLLPLLFDHAYMMSGSYLNTSCRSHYSRQHGSWSTWIDPRGNLGEKQEQKPDSEKGSSINVNSKTSLHRNQMKYVFEKAKNVFSPEN